MGSAIRFLGGKCVRCPSRDRLEMDHIDPSTKYKRISQLANYKEETFWEEVKKCQLLCKDCHRKKSREDAKHPEHGTKTSYRRCGPPACKICRATRQKIEIKRWIRKLRSLGYEVKAP